MSFSYLEIIPIFIQGLIYISTVILSIYCGAIIGLLISISRFSPLPSNYKLYDGIYNILNNKFYNYSWRNWDWRGCAFIVGIIGISTIIKIIFSIIYLIIYINNEFLTLMFINDLIILQMPEWFPFICSINILGPFSIFIGTIVTTVFIAWRDHIDYINVTHKNITL